MVLPTSSSGRVGLFPRSRVGWGGGVVTNDWCISWKIPLHNNVGM